MKKYLNAVIDTALTERQRQVVKMYYGLNKPSYRKVADKLGISKQAVEKTFKSAMKKLKLHKIYFENRQP